MKIPVYGNGQNIRDWLYVEDNCAALRLLLEKGQSGIFNIASGISARNIELAKMVASACGKGESELEFVPDRKGHDFCYSVDTAKIRSLGWAPKISLADGLGRTIKWYLENKPAWSGRVN